MKISVKHENRVKTACFESPEKSKAIFKIICESIKQRIGIFQSLQAIVIEASAVFQCKQIKPLNKIEKIGLGGKHDDSSTLPFPPHQDFPSWKSSNSSN